MHIAHETTRPYSAHSSARPFSRRGRGQVLVMTSYAEETTLHQLYEEFTKDQIEWCARVSNSEERAIFLAAVNDRKALRTVEDREMFWSTAYYILKRHQKVDEVEQTLVVIDKIRQTLRDLYKAKVQAQGGVRGMGMFSITGDALISKAVEEAKTMSKKDAQTHITLTCAKLAENGHKEVYDTDVREEIYAELLAAGVIGENDSIYAYDA